MQKNPGWFKLNEKLFVIEGADASGKATQAKLLKERLEKEGNPVSLFSFPRYETETGKMVKRYLNGEFGSLDEVKPEFAALLYSLDKFAAAGEIEQALSSGKIVVCDRFTASNAAHQGAKFKDNEGRKKFISWIQSVESSLPKPAATVYLDVPVPVSQELMKNRGEKDLHESDAKYLENVRRTYLLLSEEHNWIKIDCVEESKLLSRESIHESVWSEIQSFL